MPWAQTDGASIRRNDDHLGTREEADWSLSPKDKPVTHSSTGASELCKLEQNSENQQPKKRRRGR